MAQEASSENGPKLVESLIPDQTPTLRTVDAASLLGFRTPLAEHPVSADGKSASLLTLLGIMFTILARYAQHLGLSAGVMNIGQWASVVLLVTYALLALLTVIQAFRTLQPRFPKAPPSLAFFGDIVRLSRDQYIQRVESLSPQEALDQILNYNHTVSCIIIEKLKQLRRGLKLFKFAFVTWLLLMVVIVVRMSL